MKKVILFILVLVLLTGVGTCIYFAGNVSAVLPPIKEYGYQGNMNQLIYKMKVFDSTESNLTLRVGEPLGNKSIGYAYEITLKIKDGSQDLLYELKFEDLDRIKTKVLLIGAHNLTNDTGGYGIKAIGMKILLDKFDSEFLSPFKKDAFITITPL
ncbi:MAG: hypothetical protein EOP47_20760 [Sphingobacteriaceae bacterium]|nr:MAG: hypothetical protein EOP47_20760 [Sphingobacteriaceae bacterium]